MSTKQFICANEVAERYSVNPSTIWRWRKNDPTFPKPIMLGDNTTRFSISELEAWEAGKRAA